MKRNVGELDRNMRLAGGAAALGLGLFGPLGRRGRIIALSIGGMQLITGLTRYCPVSRALHVNTCRPRRLQSAWRVVKKLPALVA